MKKLLKDSHGRSLTKLRLNLLDACNMRCLYCMPEDQKFKKINSLLSPADISKIVSNLTMFGIEEVRLTGGEPLIHPNFKEIIKNLSTIKLKKLSITTNGIHLSEHLNFLQDHNVQSINISLDSLDPKSFEFITKTNAFDKVQNSLLKANEMGFTVKTNTVLLKNINFEEIENFLNFSAEHNIEIRFLELMKIGHALNYFDRHFVSADEAISKISKSWKLNSVEMPFDSTSFNYIANHNGKIAKLGFIASETKPFCNGCSRLRLSNQGTLRPCIMINEGPNLKDLDITNYEATLRELIEEKPISRLKSTPFKMNEIGG